MNILDVYKAEGRQGLLGVAPAQQLPAEVQPQGGIRGLAPGRFAEQVQALRLPPQAEGRRGRGINA